jgi:hypothetical protein
MASQPHRRSHNTPAGGNLERNSHSSKITQTQPSPITSVNAPFIASRLPPEIWMMIVSCYPTLQHVLIESSPLVAVELPAKVRMRCRILRALSQTCVTLRQLMLPLLWAEVDTCIHDTDNDTVPHMPFASYVLKKTSLGLIRSPILSNYVKLVNFLIHPQKGAANLMLYFVVVWWCRCSSQAIILL